MVVGLWCVIGLVIAAVSVSVLGAAFSVFGLAELFSGATLAVALMASALEFSKFVIAAFLHQVWDRLNWLFKLYLLSAVVVLSGITSMGIFGFLSNAYQLSSSTLEHEEVKLESLKAEQQRNIQEIARVNKAIDEIPENRISKKMKMRAEIEPVLQKLNQNADRIARDLTASNLQILEVKKKVGPLIYIARAFHVDIDTVVKYLILVFVSVFDPLAICLVIAVSESSKQRRMAKPTAAAVAMGSGEDVPVKMRFVDDNEEVA